MSEPKVILKLFIDTQGQRVLYAEAGKDFVDFLFSIFSLPMGTVIGLLTKQNMVGPLANLYKSIENLNQAYLQPDQTKDTLLKPIHAISSSSIPQLLLNDASTVKNHCSPTFGSSGPSNPFNFSCTAGVVQVQQASGGESGIVKGVVTYMVMDDLEVKPMSTTYIITLLNNFNVKDVSALEEKVVTLGKNEAVKLLNACLQSQKVLTDLFLNDNSERKATKAKPERYI